MTAFVVASLIPASKQHSPFLAIRAAFSTQEAADTWVSATKASQATSCGVYEVPLDPEPPKVERVPVCEAQKVPA